MSKFFTILIFALWVVAIALISVQNATPVALRFLMFESVRVPVGLVLALSAALGMVGMAIALPLLRFSR
jgi:uncharacterized integral membrane protein